MYTKEVAIAGIVLLMGEALYLGINGVLLAGVIAIIAGLTGYEVKAVMEKKANGH